MAMNSMKNLIGLMKDHDVSVVPYHSYWQKLKYSYNVLDVMEVFLNIE
jgi:hypothetical protein